MQKWSLQTGARSTVRLQIQGNAAKALAAVALAGLAVAAQALGTAFKDCSDCSEMVALPAGSFLMGTATPGAQSYETPQHRVTFAQPFALGKYEVTQAEWMAVMGDNPSSYIGPKRPVEGVSWNEIQEFVRRLSMKTGKPYRLPSEAEWEYAARAGGTRNYVLSDDARELEQYAWTAQNSGRMTHPVGEKPANKFGLHDMIGNVYEWTQDCYRDNHVGAPADGGAVLGQGCPHVVKGGSHYSSAQNLRPADRGRLAPELYDSTLGFRIARFLL